MAAGNTQGKNFKVSVETAKTDSFTMEYCRFGEGDEALVILPGLSVQNVMYSAEAIAEAYQPLAKDYTIYVFERRNALPPTYKVGDSAEDTVKAVRALGLDHFSLFGASYGGMISMTIAIRHPELVDNLIIASTSSNVRDEDFRTIENWIHLAKEGAAEKLYLAFAEALYPEEMFRQIRALFVEAAKTVTEEELNRFVILAEGIRGFDVSNELCKIQCPMLTIADKQDKTLDPAASGHIAHLMQDDPDFELYMYDGYGHAVYDTAPDLKERMLRFLRRQQGAREVVTTE